MQKPKGQVRCDWSLVLESVVFDLERLRVCFSGIEGDGCNKPTGHEAIASKVCWSIWPPKSGGGSVILDVDRSLSESFSYGLLSRSMTAGVDSSATCTL